MARQLEEFNLPLVRGGLALQPMGYLADVMQVRGYCRARDAVERELDAGTDDHGQPRMPAPAWAHRLTIQVRQRIEAGADDDSLTV